MKQPSGHPKMALGKPPSHLARHSPSAPPRGESEDNDPVQDLFRDGLPRVGAGKNKIFRVFL